MITLALPFILLGLGLGLSAFFSGSETGFYRMARVRLLIDAVGGDSVARGLLWTTQRPSIFVATSLVGNNLANALITFAVVRCVQVYWPVASQSAEILFNLALTPFIFIYGELLPKYLFYAAPNRLMRLCSPGLLVAGICFAPFTAVVWLINLIVSWLAKSSPQEIRVEIARRELGQVISEGHEAGILLPWQQTLLHGILEVSGEPVRNYMTPVGRYAAVTEKMLPRDVLRMSRRQGRNLLPVEKPSGGRELVGYVRASEIVLQPQAPIGPIRPLIHLDAEESYLSAVTKLLADGESLGCVRTPGGRTVGFVTGEDLTEAVFSRHRQ